MSDVVYTAILRELSADSISAIKIAACAKRYAQNWHKEQRAKRARIADRAHVRTLRHAPHGLHVNGQVYHYEHTKRTNADGTVAFSGTRAYSRMSKGSKDGARCTSVFIADVKKSVQSFQDVAFAMQWDTGSAAFKDLPQPLRHIIKRVQLENA